MKQPRGSHQRRSSFATQKQAAAGSLNWVIFQVLAPSTGTDEYPSAHVHVADTKSHERKARPKGMMAAPLTGGVFPVDVTPSLILLPPLFPPTNHLKSSTSGSTLSSRLSGRRWTRQTSAAYAAALCGSVLALRLFQPSMTTEAGPHLLLYHLLLASLQAYQVP